MYSLYSDVSWSTESRVRSARPSAPSASRPGPDEAEPRPAAEQSARARARHAGGAPGRTGAATAGEPRRGGGRRRRRGRRQKVARDLPHLVGAGVPAEAVAVGPLVDDDIGEHLDVHVELGGDRGGRLDANVPAARLALVRVLGVALRHGGHVGARVLERAAEAVVRGIPSTEEEGGYASTVPASRTISVGEAGPSVEGGEEEDGEGPYSYGSAAAEEEMEDPAAA